MVEGHRGSQFVADECDERSEPLIGRANNCQNLHREGSRGHDELPSRRSANGSSRLFPSISELGTGPVAVPSFHYRTSAMLPDCWHSCARLHAYRDARRRVDRDLWVQGNVIRRQNAR
jgi:hypothetical protein